MLFTETETNEKLKQSSNQTIPPKNKRCQLETRWRNNEEFEIMTHSCKKKKKRKKNVNNDILTTKRQ